MTRTQPRPEPADAGGQSSVEDARVAMRRLTRRSFAVGAVATLAGGATWTWLRTRQKEDGIPWPLRRVLQWNQYLAERLFDPSRLAPTFSPEAAREPRVNGRLGMKGKFDPTGWRLRVHGAADPGLPLFFDLANIQSLPRVEIVTELKCIEGWSSVVQWAGVKFSDFAERFRLHQRDSKQSSRYVSLSTPDAGYYVGLDMASAMHPQTLLCYEMNGGPLSLEHGGPLRLVTPLKYGIKHIKRIGMIRLTNERPADYWAERGYDWYAAH
jgi:DMSO/TMAO reductase YedYZ molybdopterin-dependent catalytic subunit